MADIADASILVPAQGTVAPVTGGGVSRLWERIALAAVLLLSIFMNFFQLGQGSYGNLYYAAGVRSMMDSLHNFFFVSYDPGGFVTVDKPPVGFWLQAISSKIFGFTPFSIFLPQALCGVLAVLLLYFLVRRHFGVAAGIVAALALAVSPISVVTNRNNTIDSTLALALLLAAWAMIHAAESGKLRWLLLSGVFVGLGFNIKMSEAYLVLPALFMTYLICAPRTWWTRIWHLALFVVVFFVLSLSWVVAVDLTPTSQRPYVGSTQTNSEVSLAFGYNGLNRLRIGNTGRGGPRPPRTTNSSTGTTGTGAAGASNGASAQNGATSAGRTGNTAGRAQGFQSGGNFAEAGAPSIFRLFGVSLGGQIAWLLPFALFGVLALAWQRRFNFQRDCQQLALVLWGFWLLAMAAFFTLDSSFHQYYMTELAPGLSAMVGIGLVTMWGDYRARGWRGWLLPLALAVTAGAQIYMLSSFPAWSSWLTPVIGVIAGLTVLILLVLRIRPSLQLHESMARAGVITVALGMLALLIAPTVWSGYSVLRNTESSAPNAGPSFQANDSPARTTATTARGANGQAAAQNPFAGGFGGFGGDSSTQTNAALISYLEAHQGNTKFLVATASSGNASPIILATNKPVMALGGFGGGDPILTVNQLQTLIKNGTVRYFLLSSPRATQAAIDRLPAQIRAFATNAGRGGFGGGQNNAVTSWVTSNCKVVPASQIQTSSQSLGSNQLYDCAPANA